MANNPDGKLESYHEIPQSKYLFLKNTAIHKRLFLYWTLIIWATVWVTTRIVNVDLLLLQFHLTNWWLFFPEGFVAFSYVYLWNWSRKSEKHKLKVERQRRAKEQLKTLLNDADGGETEK